MGDEDEFGFSPDIGRYVTRDGKTYTEHGAVHNAPSLDSFWRDGMLVPSGSHPNYADWTDDERAHQRAVTERRQELAERAEREERAAQEALVAQARAKLTEAEFEAVQNMYRW